MTRYEWTQMQRQIETAVRAQKNIAIIAKAAGDDPARREAQRNINDLEDQYARITDAAGLTTKKERMTVARFRKVKTESELKKLTVALKNPVKDGILVPTETHAGHYSPKIVSSEPNATVDVVGKRAEYLDMYMAVTNALYTELITTIMGIHPNIRSKTENIIM